MAELKKLPSRILAPSPPSIAKLSEAYEKTGKIVESGLAQIGHVVKANAMLEGESMKAQASLGIERLSQEYANDPMLNTEKIQEFAQKAQGITSGYYDIASPVYADKLAEDLNNTTQSHITKLMDASYKNTLRNEKTQIALTISELQDAFIKNTDSGNTEEALGNRDSIAKLLAAYYDRGASAKEIEDISKTTEKLGIEAAYKRALKAGKTKSERTAVMQEMFDNLPPTEVNTAAINAVYSEFNRLNKLYQEAEDVTPIFENIASNSTYKNFNADAKTSDEAVKIIAQNIANGVSDPSVLERLKPSQALPSQIGDNLTAKTVLSPDEEIKFQEWYAKWAEKGKYDPNPDDPAHKYDFRAAYKDGANPNYNDKAKAYLWKADYQLDEMAKNTDATTITNGLASSLDARQKRAPTLFEIARAQAIVGSKNSTVLNDKVQPMLFAGGGQQAKEAAEAIQFVYDTNPQALQLDDKTDMLYTEFNLMRQQGRTDYDEMIKEARNVVLVKSDSDLKVNSDIFNSTYNIVGGKGHQELNKLFKQATGYDAIATGSTKSLNDFYHALKSKYLIADGRMTSALDSTKREMVMVHGADKFSYVDQSLEPGFLRAGSEIASLIAPPIEALQGLSSSNFQYVRFPPTKILAGMEPNQIQNMFQEQIVRAAERIPNIKISEHYKDIKKANDTEKMTRNLAYPPPTWSTEYGKLDAAMYLSTKVEGVGDIEGRVFFKASNATMQNASGLPAWEVWIQDRTGREFPVQDDKSPYNNTLIVVGQTADRFAPKWTADLNAANIQNNIDELLIQQGRAVYPRFSWNPSTVSENYNKRKAYREELGNIEKASRQINKVMNAGKGAQNGK